MILMESWLSEAMSSSLLVAIPLAFAAGIVSFVSPCVLPLLPGYLSYASGLGASEIMEGKGKRSSLVVGTLGFVLGFAIVFVMTGAIFGVLGSFLLQHERIIIMVSGVLILVLAAAFMGWIPMPSTWRPKFSRRFGVAASPLLGLAFGLGWTPCIGPTLAIVLTMALNEGSPGAGAFLAFVYAIGIGLPFLVFAVAFSRLSGSLKWLQKHQRGIQVAGGILMMAVGIAMISGLWDLFVGVLRQWAASFGTIL